MNLKDKKIPSPTEQFKEFAREMRLIDLSDDGRLATQGIFLKAYLLAMQTVYFETKELSREELYAWVDKTIVELYEIMMNSNKEIYEFIKRKGDIAASN